MKRLSIKKGDMIILPAYTRLLSQKGSYHHVLEQELTFSLSDDDKLYERKIKVFYKGSIYTVSSRFIFPHFRKQND